MKFLFALFAICLIVDCVAGQNQRYFLGQVRSPRVPRQFDSSYQANVRDPRQNRGPVLFPQSPKDAIDESSGVVVGASGYGFVPPQSQVYYLTTLNEPAPTYTAYEYFSNPFVHRFNIF